MKKSLLLGLGAIALAVGGASFAIRANGSQSALETQAYYGDFEISLKVDTTGSGAFSSVLTLAYHEDTTHGIYQYEGAISLEKDDVFYFNVRDGVGTQKNELKYNSALGVNFSGETGGNITVATTGYYQIVVPANIENFGGPSDGYWIWEQGASITKKSDSILLYARLDGGDWGDTDSTFAWESSTHRLSTTRHLTKGDQLKIKNTTADTWMGYHTCLDATYFSGSYIGDNITILKSGSYTFNLGASYWSYTDKSYSFNGYTSSDDTNKNYYYSCISVSTSNQDAVDDFVADYITAEAGDPKEGDSCETKYNNANTALAALTLPQQTLFAGDERYASARATMNYWLEHKDDNPKAFVVPTSLNETSSFMIIGLVALATLATVGGFFFLRRRKEDR